MLTVLPTIPSRSTMRGAGGSSTTGAGSGVGIAGVTTGAVVVEFVGVSVGAAAIVAGFSTTAATGGWVGGAVTGIASLGANKSAATNPYVLVGASAELHSPFMSITCTASPFTARPI